MRSWDLSHMRTQCNLKQLLLYVLLKLLVPEGCISWGWMANFFHTTKVLSASAAAKSAVKPAHKPVLEMTTVPEC